MIKRAILTGVLVLNTLLSPVFAARPHDCQILLDDNQTELLLARCELSSAKVQYLGEYLDNHPDIGSLMFLLVHFDKRVGLELTEMLATKNSLRRLSFQSSVVTPLELANIAKNNSIHTLSLFNSGVDDDGIAALENNRSITALYLGEEEVSMYVLFDFLDNHHLKALGLYNMPVTNEDLDHLVHQYPYFKSLQLSNLPITDLTPLKDLNKIKVLSINSMPISDVDAIALSQIKKLLYLELVNTTITAASMNHFADLKTLKVLYISTDAEHAGIGDEGVKFIKHLPNLWSVYLAHQNITDIGAAYISENTSITDIELLANQLTDEGAITLSRMAKIESVFLGFNVIGDDGAAAFANHPSIKYLYLNNNKISDRGAIALTNQANIHYLNLSSNLLTDLTAYAFAAQTTDLDYLSLWNNHLSAAAIQALKNNAHIKNLSVGYSD